MGIGRADWHDTFRSCGIVALPWIMLTFENDDFRIDGSDGRRVGYCLGPGGDVTDGPRHVHIRV